MALMGQILDAAKPDRSFARVPVAAQGWKSLVTNTTTNEFGEFHLDFNFEPSVSLDMRIGPTYLLKVSLPGLEWAARRASP